MTVSSTGRRKARRLGVVAAVATAALAGAPLATSAVAAVAAPAETPTHGAGRYIVTFVDDPVASYDGYEKGYAATRPARGHKLDPGNPAVQSWKAHLTSKHDAALARVGATKIYDYTVTNNGVAAELTAQQASALAKQAGVLSLTKDALSQPTTTVSPDYLGLSAAGGFWSQLGGQTTAGSGLVIVNPPWQLDAELGVLLPALADRLKQESHAGSDLAWLSPERVG